MRFPENQPHPFSKHWKKRANASAPWTQKQATAALRRHHESADQSTRKKFDGSWAKLAWGVLNSLLEAMTDLRASELVPHFSLVEPLLLSVTVF
jgi:hypothetical protein